MMHRLLTPLLLLAGCLLQAQAQTQSRPYWQQEVNYRISVTLDDQKHVLTADEELEYVNNSPDPLSFIWFHLWPNAYKDNRSAFAQQQLLNGSRDYHFADKEQRGYIEGLAFTVAGRKATLETDPRNPDIAKLLLPEPLPPGGRVIISTPFRVKLPHTFSRLGHVGQSYQISQWYPKPAVYDQKGWHPIPYLDQGEFYSEFGSFDVSITLPKNYLLAATGELQNMDEQAFLDQKAAETAGRKTFESTLETPPSSAETKTLRYRQDRVHDFAWFADKRYHVWKGEVELPESKRKVTTWLYFYGSKADEWLNKGSKDIKDAVYYYSQLVGEYPYAHATAVDGALGAGGGMEYPMVTVTDAGAIIHEVGHNWFYGILGSNERQYPWMDEGINSYYEERIKQLRDPAEGGMLGGFLQSEKVVRFFGLERTNINAINQTPYRMSASRGADQAAGLPAEAFSSINYGLMVYFKTATLFRYLQEYLGTERFDKAMHLYYQRWQFKHPYPEDLQAVLEESTGEKLDWFFGDLIQTNRKLDVKLADIRPGGNGLTVTLKNESGVKAAVPVSLLDENGKVLDTRWAPPFTGKAEVTFPEAAQAYEAQVDALGVMPEVDRLDNRMRVQGLFRKADRPRLQLGASLDRPDRSQLFWLPVVGWNSFDNWMPGIAFTNSTLVQRKFSYFAMPMYSISESKLNGIGHVSYNLFPGSVLHSLTASFSAERFVNYLKWEPSLALTLPRASRTVPQVTIRYAYTDLHFDKETVVPHPEVMGGNGNPDFNAHTIALGLGRSNAGGSYAAQFLVRRYHTENTRLEGQILNNSTNATLLQGEFLFSRYHTKKDKVTLRLFAGKFLQRDRQSPFFMYLSGSADYLKETIFLDRKQTTSFVTGFEHQTDNRDGGFRGRVSRSRSQNLLLGTDDWMASANFTGDLPFLPLQLFADLGVVDDVTRSEVGLGVLYYDAGLSLSTSGGILSVYFPLMGTNYELSGTDSSVTPESFRDFRDHIRFSLHLDQLNPFVKLRSVFE